MSTGIGLRIYNKRKELGWSQDELASRMGLKSKSTICKIERGEDNLTADSVQKYADALGVAPAYLLGLEDSKGGKTVKQLLFEAESDDQDDSVINRAMEYYEKYMNASPEIQSAVELLLKSSQEKK